MRDLPHNVATAIEAVSIPPLPQVLVRLIRQVEDERSSIADLAAIVSQDPGLSARILTAANSAALHRASPIGDIKSAVTSLGTRLVRSMATCLAVKYLFDREPGSVPADLTDFWRHSLLVAETARALAEATGYPQPEEAYLAGLLHDVGELLLLASFGDRYAHLLAQNPDEGSLSAVERASLGTEHAEVGAWLADQWRLDSGLADSILFHHAAADEISTATSLPRLIWFADGLARNLAEQGALDAIIAALFGSGCRIDVAQICARSATQVAIVAEALGIEAPPVQAAGTAQPTVPKALAAAPADADEAVRALEATIRDAAVMHPLQQDLFGLDSDKELLLSLRESARILFEVPHVGFLLIDSASGVLSGQSIDDQPAIFRQTKIPRSRDAGLTTRAILNRAVCSSFDEAPSLRDRQFARAFSAEGIVAVPMIGKRRMIGVMVFGVGRAQYGRLARRTPWLLNFGRIGGVSLEAWQDAVAQRRQVEDEAAAMFQRQARRIVHETGNPLGIIKSYLKILDHKLPEGSDVRQELDVVSEEIDRVAAIVRRMSELPPATAALAPVGAGEVVRELLSLYGAALFGSKGIAVNSQIGADTDRLACDADSLKQILINLWKNAAEAMPRGGRFDISILDGVVQNGLRHVEIRMRDSGPGMPEAAIRALQFPDEVRPGDERGHGLSIVGSLAARIGCKITCRSKAGVGTTLSLLLPCATDS